MILITGNCVCVYYDFSCNYAFLSSSSLDRQDSTPDVLPTETEVSVSTQVYIFCNIGILIGIRCI